MKKTFQEEYLVDQEQILECIHAFDTSGRLLGNAKRNSIKLFPFKDKTLNVKSFKIPNIFNQIAYKYFRKSKAQRSFEYANKLLKLGIHTPNPVAYFEYSSLLLFKKSFYVSMQLDCDLTFRELINDKNYPDSNNILKAFTYFTYQLHEKDILFKDHSPGNTLIKKLPNNEYQFSLVDLNRMDFRKLSYQDRIDNFRRLTPKKEMVEIMAKEYAKLSNKPEQEVFQKMWASTQAFQKKYHSKQDFKDRWFFWRKKK